MAKIYGGRIRVRACGLCWDDGRLLLANHKKVTPTHFWAPPGGGVEFGQSLHQALEKEFLEETGLTIIPGKFVFGCEFIAPPFHAIELYFEVTVKSGKLKTGYDPEFNIIADVRFMRPEEIRQIPETECHGIFRMVGNPADVRNLSGFFRI